MDRTITLQLEPHPNNIQYPAAMAGYLLRRWNVDCNKNGSLKGPEFQLWLRNRHSLMNTSNLAIAPGYQD